MQGESLQTLLAELYRKHLTAAPANNYILEHQAPKCIANQVRTFEIYQPYLPESGTILDWGCHHAPDSCLLRGRYGERFHLFACDFEARDTYRTFHDYAQADYHQITDNIQLPYPAKHFDAVIGSGVLEHTAMDYESLKELYRVLKEDGVLILSYLPNNWSIQEWRNRVIRQQGFHYRLYEKKETIRLLKRAGFYPLTIRYQTFFWERVVKVMGLGRWKESLGEVLSWMIPLQVFSSTLFCVARKVAVMR